MTTQSSLRWRPFKPAAPTAGADWTITADGIGGAVIHSLVFRLVTSAVVAVRVPTLVLDDQTDVMWRSVAPSVQGASTTVDYGASAGVPASAPVAVTPETTVGAAPAAGAEISVTVPAGRYWQLESVQFSLTTAVAVANRQVALVIDDGVNEVARIVASAVQAASATVEYVFAGYVDESAVRAGVLLEPLPAITLGPGWRIRTVTAAIQAADQYTSPKLAYDDAGVAGFANLALPVGGLVLRRGFRLRSLTSGLDVADQYSLVVAHGFEMVHDPGEFVMPTPLPLWTDTSG